MSEKTICIALDAMGGDNAPSAPVLGAVDAVNKSDRLKIKLVGKQDVIESILKDQTYDKDRIEVVNATEIIEMSEPPVMAIRHKKDSSIVVGMKMVADNTADGFVSAGSTGAVLVGGQLLVGRIRGVERTPIGAIFPTADGVSLLLDSGANMDSRSSNLQQYAIMGSIYMKSVMGIENPRVALVNVGAEEEKGNALAKETYQLLKQTEGINFTGNIEARQIPLGDADVIVCDAFVGNVILKLYEGAGLALIGMIKGALMSDLKTKIGALLIKKSLKQTLKKLDVSQYGGAPLLGLKGLVVKTHGSSKQKEITNTLLQCMDFVDSDVTGKINNAFIINNKEN